MDMLYTGLLIVGVAVAVWVLIKILAAPVKFIFKWLLNGAVGFALSAGSAEGFAAASGFADSLSFGVDVGIAVMVGSTASGNIRAQSPVGSLIVESFSPASTPPAKRTRISRMISHVGIRFLFFTVEVVLYSLSVLTFNFTPFCFRLTPSICIYLCL